MLFNRRWRTINLYEGSVSFFCHARIGRHLGSPMLISPDSRLRGNDEALSEKFLAPSLIYNAQQARK